MNKPLNIMNNFELCIGRFDRTDYDVNKEIIKRLKMDKKFNKIDSYGRSCLHHLVRSDKPKSIKTILTSNSNPDINGKDCENNTPINNICILSDNAVNVATILLEHGAYINNQNIYGDTVLHEAASSIDFELIKFLVAKGADRKIKNKKEQTPLDIIISKLPGYVPNFEKEVIEFLQKN